MVAQVFIAEDAGTIFYRCRKPGGRRSPLSSACWIAAFLGPCQCSFQYCVGQRSGGVLSALVEAGAQKGLCNRVVAGSECFVNKMAALIVRSVGQVKEVDIDLDVALVLDRVADPGAEFGRGRRQRFAVYRLRFEQWTGLHVEVADLMTGAEGVGVEFELFARKDEELDIGAVEPGQIAVLLRQDREGIGVE